jgi:hypothetical protein
LKKDKSNVEAKPLEAIKTFDLSSNEKLSPKIELQKSLKVLQATSKKKLQRYVYQIQGELLPTSEELLQQAQTLFKKG